MAGCARQPFGERALALHAKDEFDAAAALYRAARQQEPNRARWPYLLGVLHLTLKQSHAAVENLQAAVRLEPASVPVRLRLARALFESGDAAATERVAREIGTDPEAQYWLGRALVARGDRSGIAYLKQACSAAPAFGAAHYALAVALRDAGDPDAAAVQFAEFRANPSLHPPVRTDDPYLEELDRLRENTPLEQARRAVQAELAGNLEEAARLQRKALELDPNFAQAHISLVSLYGRLGRAPEAERHYRTALAINANQPELHHNFGVVAASAKRLDEASAAFRRAIEINPYHADAMVNLGQVLEWQSRWPEAEPHYREAIRARPNFRLAHFQLGRWLVARGRHREALAHLKQAAIEGESNALFWFGLATASAGAGDRAGASRAAARAHRLAAASGQRDLAEAISAEFPAAADATR
jgi:tetratricopeptide (TPR) repeat protein